jgi:hypothetical protein
MIRSRVLLTIIAVSLGIFAETVVKSSPAFQFPPATGARVGYAIQDNSVLFSYSRHFSSRYSVEIAWSLPGKMENGSISVFTLAGTKVKTFPISQQQGNVVWDLSNGRKMATGVYFATLTYGSFKKNMQILLSR